VRCAVCAERGTWNMRHGIYEYAHLACVHVRCDAAAMAHANKYVDGQRFIRLRGLGHTDKRAFVAQLVANHLELEHP
jgi:hypothetical protein